MYKVAPMKSPLPYTHIDAHTMNVGLLASLLDLVAKSANGPVAIAMHYVPYPSGLTCVRVAEVALFERSSEEEYWKLFLNPFTDFIKRISVPLRLLVYEDHGGVQWRILVPPDPDVPRAIRWRILTTGCSQQPFGQDVLLEELCEAFRSVQRDRSWSQAQVPLKRAIHFAGTTEPR